MGVEFLLRKRRLYGIYSGRNWMFGDAMVGIDGSTDFASVRGSGPQPGAALDTIRTSISSATSEGAATRFGRFLPYVAVGLGLGDSQQTDTANGDTCGELFHTAWTLGAGVEYMMTDRVALRAEYDYSRSLGATIDQARLGRCSPIARQSSGANRTELLLSLKRMRPTA